MTPQQKAKEIQSMFYLEYCSGNIYLNNLAIVCVNQMLQYCANGEIQFLTEVKAIIEAK